MSIKETLQRFDEKKFKIYDTYNNDFRCINDDPLSDDIKQFITEEIKLAFQAGKDSIKEEIEYATYFETVKKTKKEVKEEILNKLPERKSENKKKKDQDEWINIPRIQRAIGFNSCLNQVKDIIKNV